MSNYISDSSFFDFTIYRIPSSEDSGRTSVELEAEIPQAAFTFLTTNELNTLGKEKILQISNALGLMEDERQILVVSDEDSLQTTIQKLSQGKILVFAGRDLKSSQHDLHKVYPTSTDAEILFTYTVEDIIEEESQGQKAKRLELWQSIKNWR